MTKLIKIFSVLALCASSMGLQSCFTGIESTPKITYKADKNGKDKLTPEQITAESFTPIPITQWAPGKQFYVTSDRIGLVMRGDAKPQQGDIILFAGSVKGRTVTGEEITELNFLRADSKTDTLVWRAPGSDTPALPFLVDMDVVENMRSALQGNHYFIKTALWYDPAGEPVNGRKFIPVEIMDIKPYNADFPAIVTFSAENGTVMGCVLMSENRPNATRTFDTLFAIENPRKKYPQTSDENWLAIQNSQIRMGMTRAEVRAALGAPATIDRGQNQSAAFERWTYTDGVSVRFIDGIVANEVR